MRVVVTGGAGFIGSHLVDRLCDGGHEVLVVDTLDPAAHDGPPEWLHPEATYLVDDVRIPTSWPRVLEGTDAVSHQAAKVGLGVDLSRRPRLRGPNDVGTATMCWAMHHAGWRGRLVVASTHGGVRRGPVPLRRARRGRAPHRVGSRTWRRGGSSRGARAAVPR